MHRAWKRLALILLVPASAYAFHTGGQFDKAAAAGGGGGVFYSGSRRERGWDCRACHLKSEGKIKVRIAVDPPDLFRSYAYAPNTTYKLTASLEGEWKGLSSPNANYNGITFEVTDASNKPAGAFKDYSPDDFFAASNLTLVTSQGRRPGVTSWSLAWTAPAAGTGKVTLFLGAVDGNGADRNGTLTDPLGDDVFVARVELKEAR